MTRNTRQDSKIVTFWTFHPSKKNGSEEKENPETEDLRLKDP